MNENGIIPDSPELKIDEEDPLKFKLDQILFSGLGEDEELTNAWYCLEETLSKDGEDLKLPSKPLKTILEAKTLKNFEDYIGRLSELDKCLEEIETIVNSSKVIIESIEREVEPIRDPIYQLLDTIQNYEIQQNTYLNQIEISKNFIEKFTLTEEEKIVLSELEDEENESSSSIELNWSFFKALNKLERIQKDSLELLVKEGHMVGQDIVNSLVTYSETSYKRLDKWLKVQLKILQSGYPEVSLKFKWAVQVAKNQNDIFQEIINIIIDVRSKFLIANFFQSLTKGGRPIDYNASDSLRYIGDILAWVHSAIVEEKDLIFSLICISLPDETNDDQMTLPEGLEFSYYPEGDGLTIIDSILQSVLEPILSKIKDTLNQLDHPMNSFKLTNLIQFYTNLLLKLLGPASITAEVFEGLVKDSTDIFFKISQDEMTQMIAEAQSPEEDLSVETNIRSILIDIKKILLLNESSDCQQSEKIYTLERIVQCLLHPLFEFCDRQASFINEEEQSIYLTNCLYYIQSNLGDFKPIKNHLLAMGEAIRTHEDRLIDFQLSNWLVLSGLSKLNQIKSDSNSNNPPNFEEITSCIENFNQFLYTVDIEQDDPLGLSRLTSSALIQRIKKESAKQFIDKYVELHEFIEGLKDMNFANQLRSVNEIRTLLWVDYN